jgi:regulator of cell morphogenesis and NO signaling
MTALTPLIEQMTRHHRYIRDMWPSLDARLAALADAHGATHPELVAAAQLFDEIVDDLVLHLHTEEVELFPYLRSLDEGGGPGSHGVPTFGSLLNPVAMLEQEHRHSLSALTHLESLTSGYRPPPEAGADWRATYEALSVFDRHLRRHLTLESATLFPAAMQLEH